MLPGNKAAEGEPPIKGKEGKAIPETGHDVEALTFSLDNLFTDGGKVVSLTR
jgi:hypothetical protein